MRCSHEASGPAIPVTTICAKLMEVGFSGRAVQALADNGDFVTMRYRSHQICVVAH
jgi:hypothetical protein